MHNTITRAAILAFTAFLVWLFREPAYLLCLALLWITRARETRRDITAEFDAIHQRLDNLARKDDTLKHSLDAETKALIEKLTKE